MTVLGLSSKREVVRTSIRVRTAMAVQTWDQGRYLGGRPPYGYRLKDVGPHPNKAHAAWGRHAHGLEPNPETEHVVRWMFTQRLAGHSTARIARALNDAGIPCPSAADPARNPHRTGRVCARPQPAAITLSKKSSGSVRPGAEVLRGTAPKAERAGVPALPHRAGNPRGSSRDTPDGRRDHRRRREAHAQPRILLTADAGSGAGALAVSRRRWELGKCVRGPRPTDCTC